MPRPNITAEGRQQLQRVCAALCHLVGVSKHCPWTAQVEEFRVGTRDEPDMSCSLHRAMISDIGSKCNLIVIQAKPQLPED
jgi:hypothetical protein